MRESVMICSWGSSRQTMARLNQSGISTILCQPIRGEYLPAWLTEDETWGHHCPPHNDCCGTFGPWMSRTTETGDPEHWSTNQRLALFCVNQSEESIYDVPEYLLGGAKFLYNIFWQLLSCLVVFVNLVKNSGIRCKVLHQSRGNLGKVSGAPEPIRN